MGRHRQNNHASPIVVQRDTHMADMVKAELQMPVGVPDQFLAESNLWLVRIGLSERMAKLGSLNMNGLHLTL